VSQFVPCAVNCSGSGTHWRREQVFVVVSSVLASLMKLGWFEVPNCGETAGNLGGVLGAQAASIEGCGAPS
jgi:hypothetical protein